MIQNPCCPAFSFQVNGPSVVYLGKGDHHDPGYDDMELSRDLLDLSDVGSGGTFYSGVPVDEDYCPYTLRIFPSKLKEEYYTTNDPLIFSLVVAGIFVFTSLVFVCYDQGVEYRQRQVLSKANQSSEIVASLFPKAVRDRMYQEAKEKKQREAKKKSTTAFSFTQATLGSGGGKNNLMAIPEGDPMKNDEAAAIVPKGRPIADLFPDTTIFFADLVGFTKWSSDRSPTDVFHLLESIYGAFDQVAERRNVFKVETIGDCYVAVTGIPEPQKDHASRMIRFARDCMLKLGQVINSLADEFGVENDGTLQLQMRVGLHSGPTTAGVLRGKKGRFQLFGDTVNSASRMESTGQPGLIHISQATADALKASGKSNWYSPREDMVEVKGKGLMQTYWVNVETAPSATTRHSTTSGDLSDHGLGPASLVSGGTNDLLSTDDDDSYDSEDGDDVRDLKLEEQLHSYLDRSNRGSMSGGSCS